jgi:hypothetical protein
MRNVQVFEHPHVPNQRVAYGDTMAWTIVAFTLCAFRTLMLYGDPFPPLPQGMDYTLGPVEQFFAFMLGYLLLVLVIIWTLPKKWSDPIIEVAFHPKPKSKESL